MPSPISEFQKTAIREVLKEKFHDTSKQQEWLEAYASWQPLRQDFLREAITWTLCAPHNKKGEYKVLTPPKKYPEGEFNKRYYLRRIFSRKTAKYFYEEALHYFENNGFIDWYTPKLFGIPDHERLVKLDQTIDSYEKNLEKILFQKATQAVETKIFSEEAVIPESEEITIDCHGEDPITKEFELSYDQEMCLLKENGKIIRKLRDNKKTALFLIALFDELGEESKKLIPRYVIRQKMNELLIKKGVPNLRFVPPQWARELTKNSIGLGYFEFPDGDHILFRRKVFKSKQQE